MTATDPPGCLKEGQRKIWKFVHHQDFGYTTNLLQGRSCDYEWLKITDDERF